jgi:GxxExxY protein
MEGVIYPKLSYQIMGTLFEVHNKLGNMFKEINYANAVEAVFKREGILYKRELKVEIVFEGEKLGDFYLDFLVDNKIVLELKKLYQITPEHIKQALRYLLGTNKKLGIIANFKYRKLQSKRIINSHVR